VRSGNIGSEGFVIALVKLQLFIIEIKIREDPVFFHQEIRNDGPRCVDCEGFAQTLLAVNQKIHLSAKSGARLFLVKGREEGIVVAVVNTARMEALREHFGKCCLAHAQGTFDDNETWRLRTTLRNRSALR